MTKRYLLKLPELLGEKIRLAQPCAVGIDSDGAPLLLNPLDPRSFGRSFLAETSLELEWNARVEVKSLDDLNDIYGFHCGAIASPRAKNIIEKECIPNIEFIPLNMKYKNTEKSLGKWWFVNIFNWEDVFDYENSDVSYGEFSDPLSGLSIISRRFGERPIVGWKNLIVLSGSLNNGLFLAKSTSYNIWSNLFISNNLLQKINEGLPIKRQISPGYFWCDQGPGPAFDISKYEYAGQ